jgi:hypothetical protein
VPKKKRGGCEEDGKERTSAMSTGDENKGGGKGERRRYDRKGARGEGEAARMIYRCRTCVYRKGGEEKDGGRSDREMRWKRSEWKRERLGVYILKGLNVCRTAGRREDGCEDSGKERAGQQ